MTYRTGNHWGVTIVRQGVPLGENGATVGDQLVAVVVNGDQALAERICALLNADDTTAEVHGRPEGQKTVDGAPGAITPSRRLRACVEAWSGCETGLYDPRCCRYPKSCSATAYDPEQVAVEDLEDA